LPTPMKLGRAMCRDCSAGRKELVETRECESAHEHQVDPRRKWERGLRVERGTEGKLEGRAMVGMVAGLVCVHHEHTDVPCLARYGDGGGKRRIGAVDDEH
jgi:hypothetical protein